MPAAPSAGASASLEYCGLRRERGIVRMSANVTTPQERSSSIRTCTGRVE
jgi:hypothetical protein